MAPNAYKFDEKGLRQTQDYTGKFNGMIKRTTEQL